MDKTQLTDDDIVTIFLENNHRMYGFDVAENKSKTYVAFSTFLPIIPHVPGTVLSYVKKVGNGYKYRWLLPARSVVKIVTRQQLLQAQKMMLTWHFSQTCSNALWTDTYCPKFHVMNSYKELNLS